MYFFYFTIATLALLLFFSVTQIRQNRKLKKAQKEQVRLFVAEHSLSESELKLFVSEMRVARDTIHHIERNNSSIQNEQCQKEVANAVRVSKKIFTYLTDSPKELIHYDLFLHRNLPTLDTAIEKNSLDESSGEETLLLACKNIEMDFNHLKEQLAEDRSISLGSL